MTTQPQGLRNAARLFFDQRDSAGAVRACEAWIEEHPTDPRGFSLLGHFHMAMRQPNLALTFFERAKALGLRHPAIHLGCGETLMALGRFDDAIGEFERAKDLDNRDRILEYTPHFLIAECHRRMNRVQQCIDCCDQIPDEFNCSGFEGQAKASKATILERINRAPFGSCKNS